MADPARNSLTKTLETNSEEGKYSITTYHFTNLNYLARLWWYATPSFSDTVKLELLHSEAYTILNWPNNCTAMPGCSLTTHSVNPIPTYDTKRDLIDPVNLLLDQVMSNSPLYFSAN